MSNEQYQPPSRLGRPVRAPGEKHTREKIFDAAIELFAEEGYDRTSVRKIAETIGLTESAVYRHYSGKEAILRAILSYAENRIFTPLPIEEGQKKGVSIFRGLLSPLPEIIPDDPFLVKIARIIYTEMHHNEDICRYFRKEFIERADDYLEVLFRRQIEEGKIRSCDPRALARIFNSFRSEWAFQNYILKRDEPEDFSKMEKDLEAAVLFFEQFLVP